LEEHKKDLGGTAPVAARLPGQSIKLTTAATIHNKLKYNSYNDLPRLLLLMPFLRHAFFFFCLSEFFFYPLLAHIDIGAGVEQPFGYLIVQNRQAV